MAGFWGLRLAIYLLFSRVLGKPEEGRYIQLRREWKTHLPLRFLQRGLQPHLDLPHPGN